MCIRDSSQKVLTDERQVLQQIERVGGSAIAGKDSRIGLTAFSAKRIVIDGVPVDLGVPFAETTSTFWREVSPGEFEATIISGEDDAVLRISRKFVLSPKSYEFTIEQRLENLTDRKLSVVWHQLGPIDHPAEVVRYGGDPRAVRFGFIAPLAVDPSQTVQSDARSGSMVHHQDALGTPEANGAFAARTFWPNAASQRHSLSLAWAAMTSRYFTVAAEPVLGGTTGGAPRTLAVQKVERVAIPTPPNAASAGAPAGAIGLELVWPATDIAPGAAADVSLTVYAGPTSKRAIQSQPQSAAAGLATVVLYTFGGPCGFCTFQTLTGLLRDFMVLLHDYVLFDWALAVIALVVCVRTILHPVTRWSQIKMLRSGKLMQKMAPKQKAIQEKYKDDPETMRREVARLMQEEGMGAGAGMVMGCVPALLQTPIWMALSATLYFLFELRHQGAFFGIFQTLSSGKWGFFADLAEPDRFISFGSGFRIPLLSGLMGPIDGLNVMPLLMGVVFYVQQKYLSPPPTTQMSKEQEQQMKMMKIMTVILFPLMMYNAPSGLALYFFTNSSLGILESRWIRAKAEKRIEADIAAREVRAASGKSKWDRKGKPANPARKPGLLERLSKLAEERQKMMDEAKKLQARKDKGKR